jgi:uncharacterized protein (TIGR01777 family)
MTPCFFTKSSVLPTSASEVESWFQNPHAQARLCPPQSWGAASLFKRLSQKDSCLKHSFVIESLSPVQSKITDSVEAASLPFYWRKRPLLEKLNQIFLHKHRTLFCDLHFHKKYSQKKYKILVTGASGCVGKALVSFLRAGGHSVFCLLRVDSKRKSLPQDILWDSAGKNFVFFQQAEGFHAVIHLAGENIAAQRWSSRQKEKLVQSRVAFTSQLCAALGRLKKPPQIFVAASGIGIFGNRDASEILHEDSPFGEGFLAYLAQQWEGALGPQKEGRLSWGARVVQLRFGQILAQEGGSLHKMLPVYRLGLGGPLGTGEQMVSWISLTDVLGIILFSLCCEKVRGPLNAVAPGSVTNAEFSRVLAKMVKRPEGFHLPAGVIEAVFGEMGRELLLAGQHAKPFQIMQEGYEFVHPQLCDALGHCLGV